jgi:hypothetical protein
MKRFLLTVALVVIATFSATPVFAQAARVGDRVCTGGSIVLDSNAVVDNVILFGCGARISSGAHVQRDVVSLGGQVIVEQEAKIDRSVVVVGSALPVQIAGSVEQDVVAVLADVTLDSTAVVGRDLVVVRGRIDQKEGAVVRGRSVRPEPSARIPPVTPRPLFPGNSLDLFGIARSIVSGILFTVSLAAIGMFVVAVWPQQTTQVSQVARDSAIPSLGVGCLTIIVAITLGIGLIVTLCGIPVAVLLFMALMLAWLVGWIALSEFVGSRVLAPFNLRDSLKTPIVAVVLGVVLLALIGLPPFIGWFITTIAATIGIGAVVLTRFGTRSYPAPSTVPPATAVAPQASTDVTKP